MGKSQKHMVTVPDFHIGEFPVTQALWKAVMRELPPELAFEGDSRPVERVSWNDIRKGTENTPAFLDELNDNTTKYKGYKLPSEAMWEFAARGREKYRKYEFAGSDKLNEVAWYGNNSNSETKPVGLKLTNKLGIYDMSGNVWEWCEDDWEGESFNWGVNDDANHIPTNGLPYTKGNKRRALVRGGSWFSNVNFCRVSYRDLNGRNNRDYLIGFRLVQY